MENKSQDHIVSKKMRLVTKASTSSIIRALNLVCCVHLEK